jgi:hypothetical protein
MQGSEPRLWTPLAEAIELVATRRNLSNAEAWTFIKSGVGSGEFPAKGVDDMGVWCNFEPHWVAFTAKFLVSEEPPRSVFDDPGDQLPIHLGRNEVHPVSDFPINEMLWFDRRRAAEARLSRVVSADNRGAVSLPPKFLRDLVVDTARLNELHPAPIDVLNGQSDVVSSTANCTGEQRVAPDSSNPIDNKAERPPGVSESDWRTYKEASQLLPGFEKRKEISKAARALAKNGRKVEGVRRAITRVLAVLRQT